MKPTWIAWEEAVRRLEVDVARWEAWKKAGRLNIVRDSEGREGIGGEELARLQRLVGAARGEFEEPVDLLAGEGSDEGTDIVAGDDSDDRTDIVAHDDSEDGTDLTSRGDSELPDSSSLARAENDSAATMMEERDVHGDRSNDPVVEVRSSDPDSQVLSEEDKIPFAVLQALRKGRRPSAEADDPVEIGFGGSSLSTGFLGDDAARVGNDASNSQTSLTGSGPWSEDDAGTAIETSPGTGGDPFAGSFDAPTKSPPSLDPFAGKSASMPDNFDDEDLVLGDLEAPGTGSKPKPKLNLGKKAPAPGPADDDDLLLQSPDLGDGLEIPPLDPSLELGDIGEMPTGEMSINFGEDRLGPSARGGAFGDDQMSLGSGVGDMSMSIEFDLEKPMHGGRAPSGSDLDLTAPLTAGGSGLDLENLLSRPPSGDEPTLDILPSSKAKGGGQPMLDLDSLTLDPAPDDPTEISDPRTNVFADTGSSSLSAGGPLSSLGLGDETVPQGVGAVSGINLGADDDGGKVGPGSDLFSYETLAPSGSASASMVNVGDAHDDDFVLGGSGAGSDITLRPSESGIGIGAGQSGIGLLSRGDSGIDLTGGLDLGSTTLGAPQPDSEFLLEPMEEGEGEESSSSGSQVIALGDDEPGMAPMLGPEVGAAPMLPGDGYGLGTPMASGLGMPMASGVGMGMGMQPGMGMAPGMMPTAMAAPSSIMAPTIEYDDGVRYDGWDTFLLVLCISASIVGLLTAAELVPATVVGQPAFTSEWWLNPDFSFEVKPIPGQ